MKKVFALIIAVQLFAAACFAQVTVTNPTNTTPNLAATYTSLANAITALDAITAISGPVTITLNAGNPQTAPVGGYVIQFLATTSAANTVTIHGSNNTITAFTPQTSGALNDGIFKIIGADYITIRNFTMQENFANTTTAAGTNNMTEFGVALFRVSATDGAQNNTIQFNTISLDRTYTNTFGIYSNVRSTAASVTATLDITDISGSNFGNKVYNNTISNVNYGVVFNGSAIAAQMDVFNDVGGSAPATGNTFTNWGSAGPAVSGYVNLTGSNYCIFFNHQVNDNISYNTITGANHTTTNVIGGILKNYSAGQPSGIIISTIGYNTITVTSSNATAGLTPIQNTGLTGLATASVYIQNNTIQNCAITGAATTAAFIGITNNPSAPGVLNMNGNILKGNSSTATSGLFIGIFNSGAIATTLNMNNNQLGIAGSGAMTYTSASTQAFSGIQNTGAAAGATVNINGNSIDGFSVVTTNVNSGIINSATSAGTVNIDNNQLGSATGTYITFNGAQSNNVQGILCTAGSATATTSIQNNDIRGIVHAVAGTNSEFLITSGAAVLNCSVSNNTFTNISSNTTGTIYLVRDNATKALGQSHVFNNNAIAIGFNKSGAGNTVYGFYSVAASVNGATVSVTNNNFSNVTLTGATGFYGISAGDGVSSSSGPTETISGNTVSNISTGSGSAIAIGIDKAAMLTCSSNTVSNLSTSGLIDGIYFGGNNGAATHVISNNAISGLASTGSTVTGLEMQGASNSSVDVYNNQISGISSSAVTANIFGIYFVFQQVATIRNNVIHNLSASGTGSVDVNGIFSGFSTGTVNLYNNKVYDISATGAATSGSVTGISAGLANVTAYNNFIADLKGPLLNNFPAVKGFYCISFFPNTSCNFYHNSIYLNASSTGTDFGSVALMQIANSDPTVGMLTAIDNILVNTSTPTGTGKTVAFYRIGANLSNFSASSDYNLLYAGTPGAANLIYYDTINSSQTLTAYQALVSPRDVNAISTMPNFVSSTDLHLTPANCQIDGRGAPVAAVTTDIDAAVRDLVTPDIGADEFTSSPNTALAGITGTTVCETRTDAVTGTTYRSNGCDLIAKVLPLGGAAVSGKINTCVTLDATRQYFNAEPYVRRHFDIEPATSNPTTTTATITLYFDDADFVDFNSNTVGWPKLPTAAGGGSSDPNVANLKVTQYHGTATTTPSSPGFYTANGGSGFYINPADVDVVWNNFYWAVTFDITGFSGFYVHTNPQYPLPVSFNYLNGTKQGNDHLLSWSVTCNSTPRVTLTLERSADQRNFNAIYSITADAARCNQPFNYTDAQPLAGINYYRLKIVDADGKITYSNIIALINGTKGLALLNVAPNPVRGNSFKLNATSATASKTDIVISDMQGRIVNRQTIILSAGYNSVNINVSKLAAGTYNIYAITADDKSGLIRFVKQ